ncbi:MAG: transposase, partial [Aminivibrio sp.]
MKLVFKDMPFEFIPDPNNRWVRLANLIPWEELEVISGYKNHFGTTGNPALPFRVALGALLVQARLDLTDEETVEQIKENPYIQYFLGFEGYRSE